MLIKRIFRRKRKTMDFFVKYLLDEIKKAEVKGDLELKIFADQLPRFLTGRYDFKARDKKKTKKRIEEAWQEIQEKLFCYNVRFTTSSAGTTVLVIKL